MGLNEDILAVFRPLELRPKMGGNFLALIIMVIALEEEGECSFG